MSKDFEQDYQTIEAQAGGWAIFRETRDDTGGHPENFVDAECAFAADMIAAARPAAILDVGSYRHFLLGLMAAYPVTTIDVRGRAASAGQETVVTCDAARLDLPGESFDLALSLCAIEHMGLGRYGDPLDAQGDQRVMGELIRVLRPGGRLVFSTTIHRAPRAIAMNAHRIYDLETLRGLTQGLEMVEERFFSHTLGRVCALEEVTGLERWWDVYLGCWQKP